MKKICVIGCGGAIGNVICEALKNQYYIIGADKKVDVTENVNELLFVNLESIEDVNNFCRQLKANTELWGIVFAAGVYPIIAFQDYTLELWDEVINVNLKSSFQIIQNLYPNISPGGRIIFISSGAAYLGSKDLAYSVSKSGVNGLAKSLAKHFGSKILVNTISPGIIETPMSARMEAERNKSTIESTLLNRAGHPTELTQAVFFLLDHNNSYMTGATLDINGGLYSR